MLPEFGQMALHNSIIILIYYICHLIDQVLYSQHYFQSDQNAVFTFFKTCGLSKCYILLIFYPETVDEIIFLDQLNPYSLLMENEARIRQRYRRYPKSTSEAPRRCIFLCDDGGVPRCTDSGDDFDFVYSIVSS